MLTSVDSKLKESRGEGSTLKWGELGGVTQNCSPDWRPFGEDGELLQAGTLRVPNEPPGAIAKDFLLVPGDDCGPLGP